MTFICVPIMVESSGESGARAALEQAAEAVRAGARLIEWRLDQVADDRELIRQLLSKSPAPCIVTCRPTSEGGEYNGDEVDRIAMLEHIALEHMPPYLDVELGAYERSANLAHKVRLVVDHPNQLRPTGTRLILSTHDFRGRPKDLYARIGRMASEDACAVIKVAWTARSLRDNIEAFELLAHRAKPMIALCLGRFGLMSRVLAPKFGALLTFARADDMPGTAPGQPGITYLKETFRFEQINRDTKVYGVIGWPAEHSIGPVVHNAAYAHLGHNGVYLPLPIPPEYEHFKATIGSFIDYAPLDFAGASITTPHKAHVIRFVRERHGTVDETAAVCGAANTLIVTRSSDSVELKACNTDVDALVDSVCAGLGIERAGLADVTVAIIGAGGAARAAAVGLALTGASSITLHNRTVARARQVSHELNRRLGMCDTAATRIEAADLNGLCNRHHDVIIQATPVGMADPDGRAATGSPVPEAILSRMQWDARTFVLDLIYTQAQTPLLAAARRAGCRTCNGLDMFARQALAQLTLWTGASPAELDVASILAAL